MENDYQSTTPPLPTQPPYVPPVKSSKTKQKLLLIILFVIFIPGALLVGIQIGNNTYKQQSHTLTPTNYQYQASDNPTTIPSPTILTVKSGTGWKLVYNDRFSIDELRKEHEEYQKKTYGGEIPFLAESPPVVKGALLGPQSTDTICDSADTHETDERLQMLINNEWNDSCMFLSPDLKSSQTTKLTCYDYKDNNVIYAHLDYFENCNERLQDYKKGIYRVKKGIYVNCETPTGNWHDVKPSWCAEYIELISNTFELY